MKRVLALVAVATTLLGIAIACGTSPVFVGTLGCEISDAGDDKHVCLAGQFCVASACGSIAGHCEKIDSDGCASSSYECGCNGITYYNACAREEAHVTRVAPGPCANVRNCSGNEECPGGSCAAILSLPPFDPRSFFDPDAARGIFDAAAGGALFDPNAVRNFIEGLASLDGGPDQLCSVLTAFTPRICWSLPEGGTSVGSRQVWNACNQCNSDLAAIGKGGVYYTCPSPDASD